MEKKSEFSIYWKGLLAQLDFFFIFCLFGWLVGCLFVCLVGCLFVCFCSWKFNRSPLKIDRMPKGKDNLPTIIFQGRAVKLRVCVCVWVCVFFAGNKTRQLEMSSLLFLLNSFLHIHMPQEGAYGSASDLVASVEHSGQPLA